MVDIMHDSITMSLQCRQINQENVGTKKAAGDKACFDPTELTLSHVLGHKQKNKTNQNRIVRIISLK